MAGTQSSPLSADSNAVRIPTAVRAADLIPVLLLVLGASIHLLFLLSLHSEAVNALFNDSVHRFGPGCDFFSIYAAGVKARLGESVYTIGGHVEQVPYAYAFRYAPAVAYTLGLGLSYLPHVTAYAVWLCLNELALLRNIRLTWELGRERSERVHHGDGPLAWSGQAPTRRGHGARERERVGARGVFAHPYTLAAMWLLFSPYFLELYVGQFTFITASMVFWAYVAWMRRQGPRSSAPGAPASTNSPSHPLPRLFAFFAGHSGDFSWAAAVLLKMMPLLFLPVALLRGRWKAALATLVVLGASSYAYFARFPGDWKVFTDTNANPLPSWHAGNQGLMALLFVLSGERTATYLLYRNLAIGLVALLLTTLVVQAWRSHRAADTSATENRKPKAENLLYVYAAASAAYLLLYKDVWEHHYVLLLPPLVLLALRRESPWVWLPPFLVSALPGLFVLYDVPNIGYNEDPQRYFLPAVSLLHHAWKPVAPLWLSVAIGVQAFRYSGVGEAVTSRMAGNRLPWARLRAAGVVLLVALVGLLGFGITGFARRAIAEQRLVTRDVVWPDGVFRRQERSETCGPAALAAVCRHYGLPAAEAEVARLAATTDTGTSMLGLQTAARAKGLATEARRVKVSELAGLPRPSILYFHEGHFAVLTGVRGRRFYLADPSLGQHVWSQAELGARWRGELLLVGPAS